MMGVRRARDRDRRGTASSIVKESWPLWKMGNGSGWEYYIFTTARKDALRCMNLPYLDVRLGYAREPMIELERAMLEDMHDEDETLDF
jgi:hypothetical protein